MGTNAHILVISRDQMLLQTRKLILGAYFDVEAAGRVPEAETLLKKNDFDLVVLCHTLSEDECGQIVGMLHRQVRQPLLLRLTAHESEAQREVPGQRVLMENGPFELLKACAGMLGYILRKKRRALPALHVSAATSD